MRAGSDTVVDSFIKKILKKLPILLDYWSFVASSNFKKTMDFSALLKIFWNYLDQDYSKKFVRSFQ